MSEKYFVLDVEYNPSGQLEIRLYPSYEFKFSIVMVRSDETEETVGLLHRKYNDAKYMFTRIQKAIKFFWLERSDVEG